MVRVSKLLGSDSCSALGFLLIVRVRVKLGLKLGALISTPDQPNLCTSF